MARSRNIKPAFFDNSELGAQESDVRLLFIALWQLADREGILEYNPAALRRYAFGYRDSVTENDINRYITVISQLDNGDTLSIRKLGNKQYLIITNFERHQAPHHTEKKGKLPLLKDLIISNLEEVTVRQPLDNGDNSPDSCFLIPDSSKNKQTNAGARGFEKPKLEDLTFEHMGPWLQQQETRGSPITIDVREQLERFKTHFLSSGGKDKNRNPISDYVAKFGHWLLEQESRQKIGAKNGKTIGSNQSGHIAAYGTNGSRRSLSGSNDWDGSAAAIFAKVDRGEL